ncbi:ZIP family metal transporter [Candidatus Peregrinibacteria bacterium]|nr:ZIP family metal transporter [Candidatus Peregrinibacteria bacterium]
MFGFFAAMTFVSTLLGGIVGLKYRDKLHLILGFTAGVLLGVVAFDLFPEISALVKGDDMQLRSAMVALVIGFLFFHILEKTLLIHHSHESSYAEHKHPAVGVASALALAGHSFLDGVGIGLGFQISSAVGVFVAVAVIAHDFSDGLNTVSLMLSHHNSGKKAFVFALIDAIMPVLGAFSTLFFSLSDSSMVLYLGFFTGFLLYIGASDILPEAHSKNSSWKTIAMTLIGVVFMFVVTKIL